MRFLCTVFFALFIYLPMGKTMAQESKVLELSRSATVKLISKSGNSSGSGFFIDSQHILTCFHVVAAMLNDGKSINWTVYPDLQVALQSGEVIDATVISLPTQADPTPLLQDFALVKLKNPPAKSFCKIEMASGKELPKVGDEVIFSGYPLATPGMVTHRGMVSGFDNSASLIFVQASINKGNSGGALLNSQRHVVGIVSMREWGISQGLGELNTYIDKTAPHGNVQIMGVDPLQVTKAIIQTLDNYISTGIGYARSIEFARAYVEKHQNLMK